MFRNVPVTEPPAADVAPADLVPLSHLQLDLAEPAIGWAAELAARGVEIVLDDLGRASIARADARRLIAERREAEARAAQKREAVEQAAVERDQKFRAQLWGGVRADHMPPGASPAAVMLQADKDARPRRQSVLQEALSNSGGLTYHPLSPTSEDEAS
jgi:hypothetical protein